MSGIIGSAGSRSGLISYISNEPAFACTTDNATVCPSGAYTPLIINNEMYDKGGCFNNTAGTVTLNGISTPLWAFAPNVAGKYHIMLRAGVGDLADGKTMVLSIYKNGSPHTNNWVQQGGLQNIIVVLTADVEANGTSDYFQPYLYHDHGTDRTASGPALTYFEYSGFRITG